METREESEIDQGTGEGFQREGKKEGAGQTKCTEQDADGVG